LFSFFGSSFESRMGHFKATKRRYSG